MQLNRAALRRRYVIPVLALALGGSMLAATPAVADGPTPFVVTGTSDVFDSHLVQAVIQPGFEAAYPQYDMSYISNGTGAAIAYAEAGNADAIIVHAASLENSFVADGYSAEPYGRAIFWGDFVLLGPASDPAGVLTNGQHDIATAFEDIAQAGAQGKATFVSRGGTPGTTVQEHAIWTLTSGTTLCDVDQSKGGGQTPSTTTGPCPSTVSLPSWYQSTGASQALNVQSADTCNYSSSPNHDNCYVFTDRGTFNYLQSQGTVPHLTTVTRDNDPNARGTRNALINSFHAYAVKAGIKQNGNPAAAAAFLNWITGPQAQAAIGRYLSSTGDAPFLPSAAPSVTLTSKVPTKVTRATPLTFKGTLANVVPGTPALSGVTVSLQSVPSATPTAKPKTVAAAVTSSTGAFTLSYTPTDNRIYSISVPGITKIERPDLNPVFGDQLQATTKTIGKITVARAKSRTSIPSIHVNSRSYLATVTVRISPKTVATGGTVTLYGRSDRNNGTALHALKTVKVAKGVTSVVVHYTLAQRKHSWNKLTWKLQAKYASEQTLTSSSSVHRVTVR